MSVERDPNQCFLCRVQKPSDLFIQNFRKGFHGLSSDVLISHSHQSNSFDHVVANRCYVNLMGHEIKLGKSLAHI